MNSIVPQATHKIILSEASLQGFIYRYMKKIAFNILRKVN